MTEHTRTCTHTGYLYSLNISIIWSYLYDINYWRRKWQPTHLFLPGEFHEQRSLTGCNPWGHKESDRTEQLSLHLYDLKVSFQKILLFNKETNRGFTGEEPDRHHLIQWSKLISVQFSLVAQSCPTLCDPMNRSTPGLLSIINSQSLPKLMPIELVMPSSHLILCLPLLLPPVPPSIRVFSMSQLFTWGGQNIGVPASTSVLPMNTQTDLL